MDLVCYFFHDTKRVQTMENYIERIKQVYPCLSIKDYQLNEISQNNDVIIVNGSIVFRFPKYRKGIDNLKKETEILETIKNNVSIPIPNPIYQSFEKWEAGKAFVGYELIQGSPLWKASFGSIKNEKVLERIASQLVKFLTEIALHGVENDDAAAFENGIKAYG